MFHKTGVVPLRMSRDGGASYPYIGWFYVLQPFRAMPKVSPLRLPLLPSLPQHRDGDAR